MPSKPVPLKEIESYAVSAVKRWLKKTLKEPKVRSRLVDCEASTYQVDVAVCGPEKMAKLNASYRKKKAPTDVLSFPTPEIFQRQGLLGDLVLCGPVAVRQAVEFEHSWKREIDILIVHGLLHLCHFDHEQSKREAEMMEGLERRILGSTRSKNLISRARA
jgi:rRNA maturation RNase YbeY